MTAYQENDRANRARPNTNIASFNNDIDDDRSKLRKRCADLEAENAGLKHRLESFEESTRQDAKYMNEWAKRYSELEKRVDGTHKMADTCPKCGCQVMDPFTGRTQIHDVENCCGIKRG